MSSQKPQYQPGQIVPGTVYRVHRVIGAGGMGTVYDVEDTTVGKRYVLKTLHANLADRDDLAGRLLREARALARMHHPSIVEVFTAGTTSDHLKLPYYVMEKLNGQSLRQVLSRKGRLELDQALDIGIDLLDALDHAHELGMIHRDVKPDNIYLHKAIDGTHVAKLLDFGIAKVVAATTQLTGGRFIGTFRYASPEQIMGGELTTSCDLYSAGLTLYEMVAGRGPFDDFAGEIEIGKAHASVPAPRLSRFAKVPQKLDDLIASSLEKRPAQRPKDAFKFASVLRELKQEFRQSRVSAPPSQQITAKPAQSDASTAVLISDGTHAAVTPRMDGPQSDKPTRLESPQSHNAPTEMAPSSQDGPKPDSTTSPYGPKVLDPPRSQPHPQMTMRIGQAHTLQDGAPAPMTILPHLSPQPPPVDRSAETNVSGPESVIAAPQHDTVMLPHLVHSPAPPPPPAHEMGGGVSTFGAQTTDASAKPKSSPKALFVALGAFGLVAIVGIAVVLVMHARKTPEAATAITSAVSTTAAPPPATSTAPRITITPTPVETVAPAPTPTPTPTPSPSPTPTLAPTPSPTPTLTLAPTLAPTPTAKPSAKPSATKKDPLHVGSGL